MLILTVSKRLGCCALVIATVAAMSDAGAPTSGLLASLERLPGTAGLRMVASHAADKDQPGCTDPYHGQVRGAGTAQVISLPCESGNQAREPLEGPGLSLQPLIEPAPAVVEKPSQRITF
ncbi:hypothetical protein KEM63_02750 [Halopseudomonas nanhaiensis]|uniref:hypothetical protein n=1 Tax=Halopseudomonas nanhaiensis TaxID=2830842 RepID=UPI001CC03D99|nr:hypothetical protein [Halopseudomonas nanhaiensis]UAW98917.1 hypothetical protein KEM63_02750 [Halopseudomonas nanhaiensis]